MRYGMFRLQGVIAQLMQQPMPRGVFCFSANLKARRALGGLVRWHGVVPFLQTAGKRHFHLALTSLFQ